MDKEFDRPYSSYITSARLLQKYEELELEIKQLTGKDLTCLAILFAQGWTLEPPRKSVSFADMLEDNPICGDCVHYRQENSPYADGAIIEYCDGDNYRPCAYYREACNHFCRDK